MSLLKSFANTALALCTGTVLINAAANPNADSPSLLESLNWTEGPAMADLNTIAQIQVPVGFRFTGPEGTQQLLRAMGNPTSGSELGFLTPETLSWFVVFEFEEVGYVEDDDKDELDPDALLKKIRAGTEEANRYRANMGVPPLHITGWEIPPRYNEQSHNLEWAIRAESEGNPVINYNTRLLGRKGVMEANLVIDPNTLNEAIPAYKAALNSYTYNTGERYSEYRQGDKLAKYGLAALIGGGAAAVAVKTGLFASLILFFKKGWKLLVVALIGAAAWIKRMIFGGRKTPE